MPAHVRVYVNVGLLAGDGSPVWEYSHAEMVPFSDEGDEDEMVRQSTLQFAAKLEEKLAEAKASIGAQAKHDLAPARAGE